MEGTGTTDPSLGYSGRRQEQLISDLLRCNIPVERLRRHVLRDTWAGVRQLRMQNPTWTSGNIQMDLFPRAPPPEEGNQGQAAPPSREAGSAPADGAGMAAMPGIGPDLPRQRPHTLSDAYTLPRDPSPLSTVSSPQSSPSLMMQEEQEEDGQQEDSNNPTKNVGRERDD